MKTIRLNPVIRDIEPLRFYVFFNVLVSQIRRLYYEL
nr:MAG TPA: hypothetical protein [Caudoviricetes sp.]DAW85425.1 MAG TPA: hypothetical protein [Bacteriophage sp.]